MTLEEAKALWRSWEYGPELQEKLASFTADSPYDHYGLAPIVYHFQRNDSGQDYAAFLTPLGFPAECERLQGVSWGFILERITRWQVAQGMIRYDPEEY